YGFNRTTIYKWLTAAAKPGVGLRALQARPAPGRPRRLTPGQERQVFHWINGKDPRQYRLDFGLWTRSVVADLIARKFGITLGLTAVGELLAKLNLIPQKPLQRHISAIRRRSSAGGARPIQRLHSKPRRKVARSSSGMSRGFAPMPFTGGPGGSRDRRRSWTVLVSGNQSVPPLR